MPQSIVNKCKITLKIPKVVSSKCTKKLFSSQQNRENYRILRTKVVELVYKKVNISSPWMEAVLEKIVNQSTKKRILKILNSVEKATKQLIYYKIYIRLI